MRAIYYLLGIFFFFFPCAPKVELGWQKLSPSEIEKLATKLQSESLSFTPAIKVALERQEAFLKNKDPEAVALNLEQLKVTYQDLLNTVVTLKENLELIEDNPEYLAKLFDIYLLSSNTLLTGYYEPWLEASYEKKGEYFYPIYRLPADLKVLDLEQFHPRFKGETIYYRIEGNEVLPYYSRKEIDKGALAGKGLEIAWVKDKIKLFFLHIQGSGRLIFPDGKVKHVLYAGKNGLQYVSIGRLLVEKGLLKKDEVSMQSIYRVLKDNPLLVDEILQANPSYVFFKLAEEGPFGCINQPLTPWVSVASDNSFVPWGGVLLVEGVLPGLVGDKFFTSLLAVQDTGGAIKGEHLDLFCGSGWEAEFVAGRLQHRARVYLLLRKGEND